MGTVLQGLNFGALGAFTNAFFIIPFFGTFSLYFGQVFVLACLTTRGLNAAVIAATLTSVSAAYQFDDPFLFIVLFSEMFVVHMLLKRSLFIFPSSCIYWATIGIPLTFFFVVLTSAFDINVSLIYGLSHGINGLFCASLVALGYSFLPASSPYRLYRNKPPKFARTIFALCMLTVALPSTFIALIFTWTATNHKEKEIANKLEGQLYQVRQAAESFVNQQHNNLQFVSNALTKQVNTEQAQKLIDAVTLENSSFESMLVANSQGDILVASPLKYSRVLQNSQLHSIKNRDYFIQTKQTYKPTVSDAIAGRGFGISPIIAFTSAIIKQNNFYGIVQGAIKLDETNEFHAVFDDLDFSSHYVILDQDKKIIYASEHFNLPVISNFDYQSTVNKIIKSIPTMSHNGTMYIYKNTMTQDGWEVFVITEPSEVTQVIKEIFYILVFSVFFTLILFSFIVNALAKRLTRPLEHLAKYFSHDQTKELSSDDQQVSEEIVDLTRQLVKSKNIMMDFQFHLTKQVEEKTSQLQHLNEQLYTLAQKDGLTKLLNRSGFDELASASFRNCVRNNIPVSMVLVDIDFFKKINDTYGHPFGDKCIVAIADTLTRYCKRETDLVGRYGGEEFIAMIVGGAIEEHHALIKMILSTIEKMRVKVDDTSVNMTVSIGVSSLNQNFGMTFQGLVNSADEQLYKSKRTGRNRLSLYIQ